MSKTIIKYIISFWLFFICTVAVAQSPVEISVDSSSPAAAVSPEFLGLSFETRELLARQDGSHFFSSGNTGLIHLFKTLGIKNLRVGGNTADNPTIKVPTTADVDALFDFAKAADVKVIYTLRLKNSDPKVAAEMAKYIYDHYAERLLCFAIGNEPNVYAKTYPEYVAVFKQYSVAITAAAPGAKLCGPSTTPGKVAWARDFIHDFGSTGEIALITQHAYPGGSAKKVTDPAAARDAMLSPKWVADYQKFCDNFAPAAKEAALPYRLEETNSFFHAGAKDVSNTLAAALWGLDYMHWWAQHECQGVNFHTGVKVASGDRLVESWYTPFVSSEKGYPARPLAYAIKAFDLAGHGRVLPVKVNAGDLNLSAYATHDMSDYLTVINKEHGPSAHSATVSIVSTAANAEVILLAEPKNDAAATQGITLGDAAIDDGANWNGKWKEIEKQSNGKFVIDLPPATAAVVKLSSSNSGR